MIGFLRKVGSVIASGWRYAWSCITPRSSSDPTKPSAFYYADDSRSKPKVQTPKTKPHGSRFIAAGLNIPMVQMNSQRAKPAVPPPQTVSANPRPAPIPVANPPESPKEEVSAFFKEQEKKIKALVNTIDNCFKEKISGTRLAHTGLASSWRLLKNGNLPTKMLESGLVGACEGQKKFVKGEALHKQIDLIAEHLKELKTLCTDPQYRKEYHEIEIRNQERIQRSINEESDQLDERDQRTGGLLTVRGKRD